MFSFRKSNNILLFLALIFSCSCCFGVAPERNRSFYQCLNKRTVFESTPIGGGMKNVEHWVVVGASYNSVLDNESNQAEANIKDNITSAFFLISDYLKFDNLNFYDVKSNAKNVLSFAGEALSYFISSLTHVLTEIALIINSATQFPVAIAQTFVGPEFQVNTYTSDNQLWARIEPLSSGGFVIAWMSSSQDGSGYGIYAQLYSSTGSPQGSEFRVNTNTINDQFDLSIATLNSGDFVITWSSEMSNSVDHIFARIYSSAGVPQGSEFQVSTYLTTIKFGASIANLFGGFVIAWQSGWEISNDPQDGSQGGIYARLYSSTGVAQGPEFRVNTFTLGNQEYPRIARLTYGDFVISWTSNGQDGSENGIYAQLYSSTGVARGSEFRVNTYTLGSQQYQEIAPLSSGGFVIIWDSDSGDGSQLGAYAQLYSSAGLVQGSEFQVIKNFPVRNPFVTKVSSGGFLIAAQGGDGLGLGIYAEFYSSTGASLGSEFLVNSYTSGNQFPRGLTQLSSGKFIIVWMSEGQDGSQFGVYARQFSFNSAVTPSPSATSNPVVTAPSPSSSSNPVVAPPLPSVSSIPDDVPSTSSTLNSEGKSSNSKSESPTWKTAAIIGGSVGGGITFFFCVAYFVFKKATKNIKKEIVQTSNDATRVVGDAIRNVSGIVGSGVNGVQLHTLPDATRGRGDPALAGADQPLNPETTRIQRSDAGEVPSLVSHRRRKVRRKYARSRPATDSSARKPAVTGRPREFLKNDVDKSDEYSARSRKSDWISSASYSGSS